MTTGPLAGQRLIAILAAVALVAGACGAAEVSVPPSSSPSASAVIDWHDTSLPPEVRAEDLLAEMTIDEKIGQMTQLEKDSVLPAGVTNLLLGSRAEWRRRLAADERCRQLVRDGRRPTRRPPSRRGWASRSSTAPTPCMATATSWAPRSSRTTSGWARPTTRTSSSRSVGRPRSRWPPPASAGTSGQCVAVPQDVRWGRTYEGFSEDPLIVAELGQRVHPRSPGRRSRRARFRGRDRQALPRRRRHGLGLVDHAWLRHRPGRDRRRRGDAARPPHDAVRGRDRGRRPHRHGVVLEHRRRQGPRRPSPADRGPQGRARLHGLRRLRLGRRRPGRPRLRHRRGHRHLRRHRHGHGPVRRRAVRDRRPCRPRGGHHRGRPDRRRRRAASCGSSSSSACSRRRCRRPATERTSARPPNRALARGAAAASAVLLKTTPGVLPLAGTGDVLLAGSGADDIGLQSGGWTIEWQGAAGPITPGTTIADALAARLGDRLTVDPTGAFPAGTNARTGIVVVAEPPYAEGQGDSGTLRLPKADLDIVAAVRPTGRSARRRHPVRPPGDARSISGPMPTPWSPRGCRARRGRVSPTSCSATARSVP